MTIPQSILLRADKVIEWNDPNIIACLRILVVGLLVSTI